MSDPNTFRHPDGRVFRISHADGTSTAVESVGHAVPVLTVAEYEAIRELVRNADELRKTLAGGMGCTETLRAELEATIRQLRIVEAERDEARREVCGLDADTIEDRIEYARQRGWDCFRIP